MDMRVIYERFLFQGTYIFYEKAIAPLVGFILYYGFSITGNGGSFEIAPDTVHRWKGGWRLICCEAGWIIRSAGSHHDTTGLVG